MRGCLGKLLLVAVSTAVALLLAEAALRQLRPRHAPSSRVVFKLDENGVTVGEAGFVGRQWRASGDYDVELRFNRHGLRDDDDLSTATADDLFAVGDSFTLGWGVEESARYSDVLEQLTGRRVFNLGIPSNVLGYHALVGYARRLGAPVEQLIVGVCIENDLREYEAAGVPYEKRDGIVRRAKIAMKNRLALYSAFAETAQKLPRLHRSLTRLGLIDQEQRSVNRSVYSPDVIVSTARRLAAIRADYELDRVLYVIIPSRALWIGEDTETEDQVHEALVAALDGQGLEVLDLRSALEADGDPMSFHFRFDGHWNASGHRLAAEMIAQRW